MRMANELMEVPWWDDPWPFVERMAKGEYILPEVQRQVFAAALLQLRAASVTPGQEVGDAG